jgi:hypothetical protein
MELFCRVDSAAKGLRAFVVATAKSRAREPRALQELLKKSPLTDEQAADPECILHLIMQARSAAPGNVWRFTFTLNRHNCVNLTWETITTSGGDETVRFEMLTNGLCDLHIEGPRTSVLRSMTAARRVLGKGVQWFSVSSPRGLELVKL